MDDTKLIPISRGNLEQLKAIADEFGMPRSIRWYERLLFSDFQEDEPVKCRGFLVQSDADGVVGCLCLAPIEGWFKQTRKTFYRVANFACRKKYGIHALELIAELMEKANGELMFTNSIANQTALKCWRDFGRFKGGPAGGEREYWRDIGPFVWLQNLNFFSVRPRKLRAALIALTPVDYLLRKLQANRTNQGCRVMRDFSDPQFAEFWSKFLRQNDGVITSRDPKILSELFGESLRAGMMALLAKFSVSNIVGYILLRKYQADIPFRCNYRIADLCALDNEKGVLLDLVKAAVDFCSSRGSLSLSYIGGNETAVSVVSEVLPLVRDLGRQTFIYHVDDKDMSESLAQNKGWFFGPYDGDHCLGYAGYVDL